MKKIVVICVYIGELPDNYFLWLESCKQNETIDWLIISDKLSSREKIAKNIKILNFSLNDLKNLIERKLQDTIILNKAYKLCDYKPAYGLIFEDYIKEYEFWGHCDMDMIFGDFQMFFNDEILEKYEKILNNGHLVLYKNNPKINSLFKEKVVKTLSYKTVFNTNIICGFDESKKGIIGIFENFNIKNFYEKIFIDITPKMFDFREKEKGNFCYTYENGKIYKYFINNKNLTRKEYLYIHFQKRKINYLNINLNKNNKYILDNVIIPFEKNEDIRKYLYKKKYHIFKNLFKGLSFIKKEVLSSIKFKVLFLIKEEK